MSSKSILTQTTLAGLALSWLVACDARPGVTLTAEWGPSVEAPHVVPLELAGQEIPRLRQQRPELRPHFEPKVVDATREHPADSFAPFLPPQKVPVGGTWPFNPARAIPLLTQLHPQPTIEPHHPQGVKGAGGCVLSRADGVVDVLLRIHAEFAFKEGTESGYIAPAQFEGRMVYDTREERPLAFSLHVPDRATNTVLYATDEQGRSAGLEFAHFPNIRLATADTSAFDRPAPPGAITPDEARRRLSIGLYGFSRIDWKPLAEGLALAEETGKPLHLISMVGALDDESC